MANQVYMTAKLNLADGTIVYPQVSLDNIVASISDPTLVQVATLTNGTISINNLPTTDTVVTGNTAVPTTGAVYSAIDNAYTTLNTAIGTKQATLIPGDNIITIINGSTIMANITNLDVAAIDTTTVGNGVHLTLSGGNTVGVTAMIAGTTTGVPGVVMGATNGVKLVDGIAQFDNTTVDAATPSDIVGGTAAKVIQADDLDAALHLGGSLVTSLSPGLVSGIPGVPTEADGVWTFAGVAASNNPYWGINSQVNAVLKLGRKYLIALDFKIASPGGGFGMFMDNAVRTSIPGYSYAISSGAADGNWHTLAEVMTWEENKPTYVTIQSYIAAGSTLNSQVRNFRFIDVTDVPAARYKEIVEATGYLYEPMDGINIAGTQIGVDKASAKDIFEKNDSKTVTPEGLVSSLSVGQAVDCTAVPWTTFNTIKDENDNVTTLAESYRGTLHLIATSTGSRWIGFSGSGAYYPKAATLADGTPFKYLFMADITNNSAYPVSVYFNTTIAGYNTQVNAFAYGRNYSPETGIPAGATIRAAFSFDARMVNSASATEANFGFTQATGTIDVTISKLRQFEVMALTDDAIKYLAGVTDPDNTDDLYLIENDMVDPWINIIDMKQATAVTLASGLAYKSTILSGSTCTFSTDTVFSGKYGKDAHLTLFVGQDSQILFQSPLILMDPLTPNSGHNITVKYRDGQARAYVEDTDIGYVVTVTAGTENGSLYYGLVSDASEYIVFAHTTDDQLAVVGGTVTVQGSPSRDVANNIVGNGSENTSIQYDLRFSRRNVFTVTNCTVFNSHETYAADTADKTWEIKSKYNNCKITGQVNKTLVSDHSYDLINCEITGNTTFNLVNDSYNGGEQIVNCWFHDNYKWNDNNEVSMRVAGGTLLISGSTFSDVCVRVVWGNGGRIENCIFSNADDSWNWGQSLILANAGSSVKVTVSGCTFANADSGITVGAQGTITFAGTNILNSTVSGSISGTGQISIAANAQLISPDKTGTINWNNTDHYINIANTQNLVFDGITFTGYVKSGTEGGSLAGHACNGYFKDCTITGNTVSHGPGFAAFSWSSHPKFENCVFTGNKQNYYGFILMQWGVGGDKSIEIINCQFVNNITVHQLLGVCYDDTVVHIKGCTVSGNTYTHPYDWLAFNMVRANAVALIEDSIFADQGRLGQTGPCEMTILNTQFPSLTGESTSKAYLGTNRVDGRVNTGNVILISGSTIDFSHTTQADGTKVLDTSRTIICTRTVSGDDGLDAVYTVGGTVTAVYVGGSTVLSGAGTYIYKDGANDFATPYTVTVASGTGAGTLAGAIGDNSARFVVLDSGVTSATAAYDARAIIGYNKQFYTINGELLMYVYGSIITDPGTVAITTTTDDSGVVSVAGSTITFDAETSQTASNSPKFSLMGNVVLAGTLQVVKGGMRFDSNFTMVDNAKIIGGTRPAGAAAWWRGYDGTFYINMGCTADLGDHIILDTCFRALYSDTGSVVTIKGGTFGPAIPGDRPIYGYLASGNTGTTKKIVYKDCVISTDAAETVISVGSMHVTFLEGVKAGGSTYTQSCVVYPGAWTVFNGVTFGTNMGIPVYANKTDGQTYMYDASLIFMGNNKVSETGINVVSNASYTGKGVSVYLVSGGTIDMRGATFDRRFFYFTDASHVAKVGTFSDTTMYDPGTFSQNDSTDTFTIILRDGSTHHIKGTGTWISNYLINGQFTDFTVID